MDFDRVVDRRGTGAIKWDAPSVPGLPDVVPLWVADMDFPSPAAVVEALRARVEHPVYGYTNPDRAYFSALGSWYRTRYGAEVDSGSFLLGPGAVASIGIAVRAFTAPGEGVLLMPPVYHPFSETVRDNGRVVVEAPLLAEDPFRMRLDLEAAGRAVDAAAAEGVRVGLLLFCSPHNPGGVVWTREELAALLDFSERRGLTIAADEIHGDLVCGSRPFVSLADFPGAAGRTVVFSAPNKTFNLAGLPLSHFVVRDEALRARLGKAVSAAGFSQPNVLSLTAAQAAYERGAPWLDGLLDYLRGNLRFTADFVNAEVPGVRTAVPEGTYLAWADASALIGRAGLRNDRELAARLTGEARVRCTPGGIFGRGGDSFLRINAAIPRPLLAEGLRRLARWAERVWDSANS